MKIYVLVACDGCDKKGHAMVDEITMPVPAHGDYGDEHPELEVVLPEGWVKAPPPTRKSWGDDRAFCPSCPPSAE